jgi:Arc/MetJ family transcription regulator
MPGRDQVYAWLSHGGDCGLVSLTNMHREAILMHMRTTLILDDDLVAKARGVTGVQEKTALVHEGLRALIARESARKLAALGGSETRLRAIARRRPRRRAR